MSDIETKITNKFMLLEFILCAIIIFCNMSSRHNIVSAMFTLSFIVLAAFFCYLLNRKRQQVLYTEMLSIIWVSLICVLINTFIKEKSLNFVGMQNYFMFCSTIIFMYLMINVKTNEETAKKILIFNIAIALLYPWCDRFLPQTYSDAGKTFNFFNPNLAGMWILQSVLYLTVAFFSFKSKLLKAVIAVVFVLDFGLLQETNARNCTIAVFLFAAVCLWVFIKIKPRFPKWIIAAVNILPIAFLFVYLKFIDLVIKRGWFNFLISEGKSLASRVEIWERNLNKIKDCWLIGSYYTAAGNTHNAHLVILGSFGVITLVLTIYFMYKLCCILNESCRTKKSLYCLAAFFAVIFMGIGEGALFSGAMGLYIMACGFIYLARCYNETEQLKDGDTK